MFLSHTTSVANKCVTLNALDNANYKLTWTFDLPVQTQSSKQTTDNMSGKNSLHWAKRTTHKFHTVETVSKE